MVDHGAENISVYLKKIGLSGEQNCLVLTPDEHYYYGEEDLKSIHTLVNLKRMNLIKDPDRFLHNLFRILAPNANFIGCFKDTKPKNQKGAHSDKTSGLLTWFVNILEKKPEQNLSKSEIMELLETHGFRIVDMTEIDGLIFFCSRNVRKQS
jgi:ubiquinone/menaquinone biosynthesis C-methylase UbiE